MSNNVLRDERGRVIGLIETISGSCVDTGDANDRYLGNYDPQTNITRDSHCLIVRARAADDIASIAKFVGC